MLCINYCAPDMEYIDEAPQIKIRLRATDYTLREFIQRHNQQHIYVTIDYDFFGNKEYAERLKEIQDLNNWTLIFPLVLIQSEDNPNMIDNVKFNALKDLCHQYIFSDRIGNWEILQFVISLKPSEVYITNMLGFDLNNVRKVCGEIKIRAYANMAQAAWDGIPAIKKFFIRPEDISFYSKYIDSIEFIGDAAVQEVCYKTYSRGYWYGDLSELIIGLDDSLDSRRLPEIFGVERMDCKKRCITGGTCSLCRAMIKFTEVMEKTDTQIIPSSKQN